MAHTLAAGALRGRFLPGTPGTRVSGARARGQAQVTAGQGSHRAQQGARLPR